MPVEDSGLAQKKIEIEQSILEKKYSELPIEEIDEKRKQIRGLVNLRLKQKVFNWKSIDYNKFASHLYMITRSTSEYAVLDTIFNEISSRDPRFRPKSIFDFGSGIGSVLWYSFKIL